jgi:hypothetical protein
LSPVTVFSCTARAECRSTSTRSAVADIRDYGWREVLGQAGGMADPD